MSDKPHSYEERLWADQCAIGDRLRDSRNATNHFFVVKATPDFIVMENVPSNGHKHLVYDHHEWMRFLYKAKP